MIDAPATGDLTPARRLGIVLLGLSLVLALFGAGFVQWRQYALLAGPTVQSNDALGWSLFQLEVEQLRLRNELQRVAAAPEPRSTRELELRFDIFVSRVDLADHDRAQRFMGAEGDYAATIARLRAFVVRADRFLGPRPEAPLRDADLRSLLAEADAISPALHDLSNVASQLLYEQAAQRSEAVRTQSRLGIGLTLFQCLVLLVFGTNVLRQVRVLERSRARLQTLAEHLSAARVEAEVASRAASVFLANMSHEIRTPFHAHAGDDVAAGESTLTPQQAAHLDTARQSVTTC